VRLLRTGRRCDSSAEVTFGNGGRNISLVVRSITERLQYRRREVSLR
jgi:hypothetical protein